MKIRPLPITDSRTFVQKLLDQRFLLFLSVPFIVWLIIFAYIPLAGWLMAFQDFKPNKGVFGSDWVGLYHFKRMFTDPVLAPKFWLVLRNTLGMSFMGLAFGFTVPIIFAILLNEATNVGLKRFVQTVSYLPHFVSWVIVANIVTSTLSPTGTVNDFLMRMGVLQEPYYFMTKSHLFWWILTLADVWKETGWNAIIYIAAMTSIDPQLYEAAVVDGANRFQRIWHITIPGIRSTVVTLFIMSIGNIINIGFEKQWLLSNAVVQDVALVLDKYIIDFGISNFNFSYGTALGMFKSLISIILIFSANKIAKRYGENIM